MTKSLSSMSLEELWRLFPIQLVPHDPAWQGWYDKEAKYLASFLPSGSIYRLSHIGSTAIAGIWAKPIVDILLEVQAGVDMLTISDTLTAHGYLRMSQQNMTFNKGYTPDGFAEKVFHLHLRAAGDADEVYFRDYLNTHPGAAQDYEALKLSLWKKYEHDRDAYTDAKAEFVQQVVSLAKGG